MTLSTVEIESKGTVQPRDAIAANDQGFQRQGRSGLVSRLRRLRRSDGIEAGAH